VAGGGGGANGDDLNGAGGMIEGGATFTAEAAAEGFIKYNLHQKKKNR
tara:strand:- start:228 stop:371 length:144 start_codon:yes stop_codon:yes gene_type:complete